MYQQKTTTVVIKKLSWCLKTFLKKTMESKTCHYGIQVRVYDIFAARFQNPLSKYQCLQRHLLFVCKTSSHPQHGIQWQLMPWDQMVIEVEHGCWNFLNHKHTLTGLWQHLDLIRNKKYKNKSQKPHILLSLSYRIQASYLPNPVDSKSKYKKNTVIGCLVNCYLRC